jgi:hypothetical protein
MDEKEIRATTERLIDVWTNGPTTTRGDTAAIEVFKIASDALVKFTRLVEAVECIASCQMDVADAIEGAGASLEAVRPEGTC